MGSKKKKLSWDWSSDINIANSGPHTAKHSRKDTVITACDRSINLLVKKLESGIEEAAWELLCTEKHRCVKSFRPVIILAVRKAYTSSWTYQIQLFYTKPIFRVIPSHTMGSRFESRQKQNAVARSRGISILGRNNVRWIAAMRNRYYTSTAIAIRQTRRQTRYEYCIDLIECFSWWWKWHSIYFGCVGIMLWKL